ncbi:MAG: carboxypeptidase-like regulatory domain-containing protein [Pyrinomonadaceae bacterium]
MFYVSNSAGSFVSSAKLELRSAATDESILYEDRELTPLPKSGAFKLFHGMCGSHHNTKLSIRAAGYDAFEAIVDLPLNSSRSPHAFSIRLKRKGSTDIPSIEPWARLIGEVKDSAGVPVADAAVSLIGPDQRISNFRTTGYGMFYFTVPTGIYSLRISHSFGRPIATREGVELKPGPEINDISIKVNTRSNPTTKSE